MSNFTKLMQQAAAGVGGGDFYPYTVDYSARFNDDDSAVLYRDPSSNGDADKVVISLWVKRANIGLIQYLASSLPSGAGNNNDNTYLYFATDNTLSFISEAGGGLVGRLTTSQVFRDSSAWYHIVAVWDSGNATSSDRIILYVNGTRVTSFSSTTYPSQNADSNWHKTGRRAQIGARNGSGPFDGYIAQAAVIDGTIYTASAFGETKNGVWIPKSPSVTYGTNGFYLDFSNSAALGTDVSGNGNNLTSSGLTSSDQVTDTPTDNFATWDPLDKSNSPTIAEGNLKVTGPATTQNNIRASFAMATGKWYWEVRATTRSGYHPQIGIYEQNKKIGGIDISSEATGYIICTGTDASYNGKPANNASFGSSLATFADGDIVGVAYDADNGKLYWRQNGTWLNSADPVAGTGAVYSSITGEYAPAMSVKDSDVSNANFGQDGTFAGTTTAGGYSDENGQGDFKASVPSGFLALCSANLPEPTIGPNSDTTSDENFNTVLYVGNGTAIGSGGKSVTGVGFQPDMVWTKNRDAAQSWAWMDTQIGTGKYWTHNYTSTGVITNSESLASMDSDGFTVGSLANANVSGQNYVAYCFKKVSGVFDTVGYSGTGSVQNISHNLGAVPKVIIVKRVINANTAPSYFDGGQVSDPQTDYIGMFDTGTFIDNDTLWNDTAPTSTQFTVGTSNGVNLSSDTFVVYLFAEVEGFSKFGTYTGNGSTDGPFIYTGFIPAFIMVKRTDSADNWNTLIVPASLTNGPNDHWVNANQSAAEGNSIDIYDLLSNGFKLRSSEAAVNASGGTYIYMAFAENPFKYSNAR